MKWALESEDKAAEEVLSTLILDWPFDFILFEGTETRVEANIMKHIINMPAATQRLRDFCGLDQGNMMRVAAEVRNLIKKETPGKVAVSAVEVHAWMTNSDNINWGLHHVPTLRTVKDLLKIGMQLTMSPRHSLSLTGPSVNSAATASSNGPLISTPFSRKLVSMRL